MDLARHATDEQAKVILDWKEKREGGSKIFEKCINSISIEERKEILEMMNIEATNNEQEEALKENFPKASVEMKKEWLEFAQDFCNTLGEPSDDQNNKHTEDDFQETAIHKKLKTKLKIKQ